MRTRQAGAAAAAILFGVAGLLVTTLLSAPGNAAGPVTAASVAPNRPTAALSGVGYADRDEWARWRGQPVQVSETWNDPKDSSGALTWGGMNALWTAHDYFADGKWNAVMSIAQPMYASNENVAGCASVSEISTWIGELARLWPATDANGHARPPAMIRLGWEFNGDWYSWKQNPGDAANFKNCWIRWWDTVKAVDNGRFNIVWNPNSESSNGSLNVTDFFPGAQYVDAAGPDYYAISDNGQIRDPNKHGGHGEPVGIEAWRTWVHDQGVPFAVPEWGIRDQTWGSTDPAFISQLRTAFTEAATSNTGLAWESYFDGSTDFGCQFSIHDQACGFGIHQAAADRYQLLWRQPYHPCGCSTPPSSPPSSPPANGTLPRTGWTVTADSQETTAENGAAANVLDGNAGTLWHSRYSGGAAALPHTLTVDLHASHTVTGLVYLPRPAGAAGTGTENGRIGSYRIELSTDGSAWTQVATGSFADNASAKPVTFTGRAARFVRLTALSEAGNRGPWSTAAELNLTGS